MRLPHLEFHPLDRRPFAARQPQDEVIIMRAEPVPEEACRHGEMHDLVVHLLDLDPSKPTGEDVFSQLSA
jgi:hypothetical protein